MVNQKILDNINAIQIGVTNLYNELGPTDEVIDLQVAINQFRHKHDIVDFHELSKDNEGFVQ